MNIINYINSYKINEDILLNKKDNCWKWKIEHINLSIFYYMIIINLYPIII